ncbi:MAG: isoprenylcysteine carboxylmethyltransferase family protein [Synergistaceae bacterium]|nr:isoprenylcysteine carboxylmethyltransferase family protein [Synergistaceae bacterium]
MQKFREFIFKMRGGVWTLLFVIILFMTRKAETSQIYIAVLIITLGQVWRFWSAGSIGLYRGENVKAARLATRGAYALMRNPLYFGNFLIGLGWSIIAGFHAVIMFIVSFYVLYVLIIIPHEEKFLLSKFNSEYESYCSRVKRFFPASLRLHDVIDNNFDSKILIKSEIHTLITTLAGTLIIIAVSCYTS